MKHTSKDIKDMQIYIESEITRHKLRQQQSKDVMPLIGGLLDAWDDIPNDVKYDTELERLTRHINKISEAMENE